MKQKYKVLIAFLGAAVLVSLLIGRVFDGDWRSAAALVGGWGHTVGVFLIWIFWLNEGEL